MHHTRVLSLLLTVFTLTVPALPKEKREVQMYSKKLDYDQKGKKVRLIGDVKITSQSYTMTAPYAEFLTEKKIGEFQGGVTLQGEGTTATGKTMKIFYLEQRALLDGSVRLVSQKALGNDSSPTVMTGDKLEYFWTQGYGVASGKVYVVQGQKRAFSDKATYYRDRQMVFLEGNVRVERGDGDWLSCTTARMNLANQVIEADGGVTARTLLESKDKPASKAPELTPTAPEPMEPKIPLAIPTVAPPAKLPGVDE